MHLFICETINKEQVLLSAEESQHAIKALRLRAGDSIAVTDGKGTMGYGVLLNTDLKGCLIKIENSVNNYQKRNYHLHIAIAPTRQTDRFEWFLEKAVELGIDEITPLICHESVRTRLRNERLQKIIESAVKQSVQAYMPKLNESIAVNKLASETIDGLKLVAHCADGIKLEMANFVKKEQKVLILIGPEGDFTKDEIKLLLNNNFKAVSLGQSRLRTETAGVYACSIMRTINAI